MTVSSAPREAGPFVGNGVTTLFPFDFKVFAASDLQITHIAANGVATVLTSGFTVVLNADQDADPGGTITYPNVGSPMASTETLVALSTLPYEQDLDLTNAGRFLPQSVENALDYIVILIQQMLERMSRMLTFPVGDTADPTLPSAHDRAGRYLAFDAEGNPIVGAPVDGVTLGSEIQTAVGGQTLFTLTSFTYAPGTNALAVTVNGLRLLPDLEFTETSSSEVTILVALEAGDQALFTAGAPLAIGSSAAVTRYIPGGAQAVVTNVQARLRAAWKRPEENGAVADGVHDDTAAIQRAIDYLELSGAELLTLELSARPYLVMGTLTITRPIQIVGQGVLDFENARPTTRPPLGSWLIHGNTFGPLFQISDPQSHGVSISKVGFYQLGHPAPGVGWAPAVRDFVIRCENTQGTLKLRDVHFHNVYLGVLIDDCARPVIENITGQFFLNAFTFDRIFDVGQFDGLHAWTYWSEENHVLQWTQANCQGIVFERVDGMRVDNIFTFAQAISIYCGVSPSTTGAARVVNVGTLYSDFCGRALVVDAPVVHITIDDLFHLGQAWPGIPVNALPGACGIHITSASHNSNVQIGSFYDVLAEGSAVKMEGANDQLWTDSSIIEQFDKGNTGAAAVAATATSLYFLGTSPSQLTYLGAIGPHISGAGVMKTPVTQQYTSGNNASKVITAAAAAGQLAVVGVEGEANAGITVQALGNGAAQLGGIGNKLSFAGGAAAVVQTVNGSRGGNAALASLLTALAAYGLITDATTP